MEKVSFDNGPCLAAAPTLINVVPVGGIISYKSLLPLSHRSVRGTRNRSDTSLCGEERGANLAKRIHFLPFLPATLSFFLNLIMRHDSTSFP